MSEPLYVAAGGGGDALAAVILHQAHHGPGTNPTVLSYSWDRYLIDPTPGPRSSADFTQLARLTDDAWQVSPDSRLTTGGISGLALLARHTTARFVLLDPTGGAVGMRRQITQLLGHLNTDQIVLVDVGGDVAAHGHESTLCSPLGDSLALAAIAGLAVARTVAIAGPGLDGELSEAAVRRDLTAIGARTFGLRPNDVTPYLPVLENHPSEATMLVMAAASGIRGRVEIRDAGALVSLTSASADVLTAPADAVLSLNAVARKLVATRSFVDAEHIVASLCGTTELAHERHKADTLASHRPAEPAPEELLTRFARYRHDAADRGAELVTFRRLTETLGLHHYSPAAIRTLTGPYAHRDLPLCRITN